jgi:hypothetical protein
MTIHLTSKCKQQVLKLAGANEMTGSEYINSLISNRLVSELDKYRLLQEVFDLDRTDRFE